MDTIDLGNNESLVYGVFPNQDGTFKAKRLKPKMVPVAGWKETQVSDMDFDTIMEKAYEEYFEGLAEGEEALSFSEFKQALSSSAKSNG